MSDPKTTARTMRLRCNRKDSTLDEYLFTDLDHARTWLTQPFVRPGDYRLEEVEVGEMTRCKHCKGEGFTQSVKLVRRLSVEDFLAEVSST